MSSSVMTEVDFIEELRLRRWARENYLPRDQRCQTLHPVVLDEMHRKEVEQTVGETVFTCA